MKAENPLAEVGVWSQDEARFGLQPIIKKRWAKRVEDDQSPKSIRVMSGRFSYGAVEMSSGESFFLTLPNLQASSVEIFLREFAEFHSLGKQKIAILLWDGAPAHRAKLKIPEGIELLRIPPNTPELNPSERLWLPLREAVSNRCFRQIDEMEEVLLAEMNQLSAQKEYLSGLTNYHWLPSAKSQ